MLKNNRDCGKTMEMKYEKFDNINVVGGEYMTAMPQMMTMPTMGLNGCCNEQIPGVICTPIYECPEERVCHRYIEHEVPHICPCNTRIVNHHIYRHTYAPCYTCCEENVVSNIYDGCQRRF